MSVGSCGLDCYDPPMGFVRSGTIGFAAVCAILSFTSIASGNSTGGWGLVNQGNCGGTCHLRGDKGDISGPANFTIVNDQAGIETIGASDDLASDASAESGIIQTNNATQSDCDNKNTAPNTYNFDEVINILDTVHSCVVRAKVVSEIHLYRTQRLDVNSCPAGFNNCVANFIDDVTKQTVNFDQEELTQVYSEGELIRNTGATWWNSNTSVTASYPDSGSVFWSRTSDVHHYGTQDSWTVIGSANCAGSNIAHWHVGDLASGFTINFVASGGACG